MRLRALELSDLDLLFAIENDPSLWPSSSTRAPYSRTALKQHILQAAQHDLYALRQLRLVGEVEERGSWKAVVLVDLIDFSPEHHRAEVGIVVLPDYRKQGCGLQALQLLADYARSTLSLHQLYAYVPCQNVASRALFAKAGYEDVAQLEDWIYYGKTYHSVRLLRLRL